MLAQRGQHPNKHAGTPSTQAHTVTVAKVLTISTRPLFFPYPIKLPHLFYHVCVKCTCVHACTRVVQFVFWGARV